MHINQLKVTIQTAEKTEDSEFTQDQLNQILVVTIVGPSMSTHDEIEVFLSAVNPTMAQFEQTEKALKMILDVSGLGMIGSMGLGQAIALKKRLGAIGGDIALAGPNDVCRATLHASALERYVWVFNSVDEAVSGMLEEGDG